MGHSFLTGHPTIGQRVDREPADPCDFNRPGGSASVGGNQQKVVLARAISASPRVFLLDEPTRGVDVGAKVEVYNLIGQLAAKGAAVVIVSSDLLELLGLCDRIGVMRAGRMAGEVDRAEFSQDRLMSLAAVG